MVVPKSIYQLKVTLTGIDPTIWRQIQVPSALPLSRLHDVLQVAMGWTDSHLHQFEKDGKYWGIPEHYEEDDIKVLNERRVDIGKVLLAEGDSMVYVYDFGDDWRHRVVLEKILPQTATPAKPVCIAGERRCPPEDVGGPSGYEEFLKVIFEPGHEEFDHFRGWAGGTFHAEEFDAAAVNDILDRMHWPVRHRR